MNLLDRASLFLDGVKILSEWLGNGGVVVAKEDAQRRADVCLKCPYNQDGPFLPFAIAAHIHRTLEIKKHLDLSVVDEDELKTCMKCQCNLRLKVWLPLEDLMKGDGRERLPVFPSHCWLKTEQPQTT